MFKRKKNNEILEPINKILDESGVSAREDSSIFEKTGVNGNFGCKFRSRGINLPLKGTYEVTITKDFLAYYIYANNQLGEALYELCIPVDCKKILGRISIPRKRVFIDGEIDISEAKDLIDIFVKMYYSRYEYGKFEISNQYGIFDMSKKELLLKRMLSYKKIVLLEQMNYKCETLERDSYEISFERNIRKKDMIVMKNIKNKKERIEINIEDIYHVGVQYMQFVIEAYGIKYFEL